MGIIQIGFLNFESFFYSLFNFGWKLALQIIKFIFRNFYGFFDTPEGASIVWKNKNLSQPTFVVYILRYIGNYKPRIKILSSMSIVENMKTVYSMKVPNYQTNFTKVWSTLRNWVIMFTFYYMNRRRAWFSTGFLFTNQSYWAVTTIVAFNWDVSN